LAASEVHTFRNNLINEFRFGYNHLNSHRFNLNYNINVSQQLDFPGVPFGPLIGGLPSIGFADGTIEITSRANLQLRGIRTEDLGQIVDSISSAGLLPSQQHDRGRGDEPADPVRRCTATREARGADRPARGLVLQSKT